MACQRDAVDQDDHVESSPLQSEGQSDESSRPEYLHEPYEISMRLPPISHDYETVIISDPYTLPSSPNQNVVEAVGRIINLSDILKEGDYRPSQQDKSDIVLLVHSAWPRELADKVTEDNAFRYRVVALILAMEWEGTESCVVREKQKK